VVWQAPSVGAVTCRMHVDGDDDVSLPGGAGRHNPAALLSFSLSEIGVDSACYSAQIDGGGQDSSGDQNIHRKNICPPAVTTVPSLYRGSHTTAVHEWKLSILHVRKALDGSPPRRIPVAKVSLAPNPAGTRTRSNRVHESNGDAHLYIEATSASRELVPNLPTSALSIYSNRSDGHATHETSPASAWMSAV